jgi:hypothetical protein
MRKSRFSEVQIDRILRQVDAGEKTVGQLCLAAAELLGHKHAAEQFSAREADHRLGG